MATSPAATHGEAVNCNRCQWRKQGDQQHDHPIRSRIQIVKTKAEDYTAGELNEPLDQIPASRWLDGSQWHTLTYLGSTWGKRDTRYSNAKWIEWAKAVTAKQGVITLDMGRDYSPQTGSKGIFTPSQAEQFKAISSALK